MEIVSTHDNFIMYHSLRDGDLVETGEKPILADVSSYKNFFASCESIVNIQKNHQICLGEAVLIGCVNKRLKNWVFLQKPFFIFKF